MKKSTISDIISSLLILLFTYTSSAKLSDHAMFYSQLLNFPLLNHTPLFLSWFIPIGELFIAFLLFVPKLRKYGLIGSVFMLFAFTVFLVVMIASNDSLPCSCGGVIAGLSWPQHIVLNLFFLVLALTGLKLHTTSAIPPVVLKEHT